MCWPRGSIAGLPAELQHPVKCAHLSSLICNFVVIFSDSMISLKVSISAILSFQLASVVEQDSLCLTWSETSKTAAEEIRCVFDDI